MPMLGNEDKSKYSIEIAKRINIGEKSFFFLGAGASIDSALPEVLRLPDGNKIKRHLLDTMEWQEEDIRRMRKNIEEVTPEIVWGEIIEKSNHEIGINILRTIFEYNEKEKITIPIPSSYRFIAKLVLNGSITALGTTNFDEKLDEAFSEQINYKYKDRKLIVAATEEDFKEFLGKITPMIYKFHGTLSKPYSIVSNPQEALSDGKKKALSRLIKDNDIIVFIGYSGRDPDILKVLEDIIINEIGEDEAKCKHIYWCYHYHGEEHEPNIHPKIEEILKKAENKRGFNIHRVSIIDATAFLREIWRNVEEKEVREPLILGAEEDFCRCRYKDYIKSKRAFPGRLIDPIYGYIDYRSEENEWTNFPKEIDKLIDCGAIQRMRNIKQLSLSYYIFPDGTHTRFSHSLGVAHLTLKALLKLKESPILKIDRDTARNCIIAALLHDIGHGPYGHATEMFMNRTGKTRKHEDYTISFIDKGLLDLHNAFEIINFSPYDVKSIIKGSLKPELYALHMLIANDGFDIDRLDFLLRDIYHTGRRVGEISLSINPYSLEERLILINTLINNLTVTTIGNLPVEERRKFKSYSSNPNTTCLCFNDDEEVKRYLDDFFKLYIEMYENVYYRDLNRCAQSMLSKALYFAYEDGEIELEDIYGFTDPELFTLLENSADSRVRELTKCVKYRFLFEPICQFTAKEGIELNNEIALNEVESELCNALRIGKEDIDKMVIIDLLHPKRIDDRIYLKNNKEEISPYYFRERVDDVNKKKYENLKRWKGYIFVPQKLLNKKEDILKLFREKYREIIEEVNEIKH